MTQFLQSEYFKDVNDILYMKVPVLIIYNEGRVSGLVVGSINIGLQNRNLELRLTINPLSKILDDVMNGTISSLTLNMGGVTFGGQNYFFGYSIPVPPNEVDIHMG